MSTTDERLTVVQAAERIGCKPGLVYKLCAENRLRHHRIGFNRGKLVILARHVREYLDGTEVLPVPPDDAPPPPSARRAKVGAVKDYVGDYERRRKGPRR